MPSLDVSEYLGLLHTGVKKGSIANTTSTTDSKAAIAGWIVQTVYDSERFRGENRPLLLKAIAQAMGHYKGDF